MPNRILKESICYSEDIEKLNSEEEVFFYRLLVNCDDYGRIDSRLQILKARLYPLKENVNLDDINRYLMKLSDLGMVLLYKNKGVRYLQLINWEKHQQVRAKRSKYPNPADENSILISCDIKCNHVNAYVPENPYPYPNPNLIAAADAVQPAEDNCKNSADAVQHVAIQGIDVEKKYFDCFGTMITNAVLEEIREFLNDNLDAALIVETMCDAARHNARNWSYSKKILNCCVKDKVLTLEQYNMRKQNFEKTKSIKAKNAIPQHKNFEQRDFEEIEFDN